MDHFKAVNDKHGHAAGDEVLRALSRTAAQVLRPVDFLSRHGGDEFVVLLPGLDKAAGARVAERIRRQFEEVASGLHAGVWPTVSLGVAATTEANISLESLLAQADRALYASKKMGRNRVSGSEDAPATVLAGIAAS